VFPADFRSPSLSDSFHVMTAAAHSRVTLRVQLFASYAEALGQDVLELSLDEPASVLDAVQRIRALPGGDKLPQRPLCAVNLSQVTLGAPLKSGDELALLPPMAGG
jgi:molybdopterin converting factor small subunit